MLKQLDHRPASARRPAAQRQRRAGRDRHRSAAAARSLGGLPLRQLRPLRRPGPQRGGDGGRRARCSPSSSTRCRGGGPSPTFATIDHERVDLPPRLSDLGWDEALWDTLTSFYPYCMRSDAAAHQALYEQLRHRGAGGARRLVPGHRHQGAAVRPAGRPAPAPSTSWPRAWASTSTTTSTTPAWPSPTTWCGSASAARAWRCTTGMLERHLGNQGQYLWISYDFDSQPGPRRTCWPTRWGPATATSRTSCTPSSTRAARSSSPCPTACRATWWSTPSATGSTRRRSTSCAIRAAATAWSRTALLLRLPRHDRACCGRARPTRWPATPTRTSPTSWGASSTRSSRPYPRVLRPDVFTADADRYRAIADTVAGRRPAQGRRRVRRLRGAGRPVRVERRLPRRGRRVQRGVRQLPRARAGQRLPERSPCPARRRRRWSRATTSSASSATW